MARAPFQILLLPFRCNEDGEIEYAIFRRSDLGYWQGIAGGGEEDEAPLEAARREGGEEGGIPNDGVYIVLDSRAAIPVSNFADRHLWDANLLAIPEYTFGVDVTGMECILSTEHSDMCWCDYHTALDLLHWESNRTALQELHQHLLQHS